MNIIQIGLVNIGTLFNFEFSPAINFNTNIAFAFKFTFKKEKSIFKFFYTNSAQLSSDKMELTIKKIIKLSNKLFSLNPEHDFEVQVRNKVTNEFDADKSKAVKMFLKDFLNNQIIYVDQYIISSEASKKFILENKLVSIDYELQKKYIKTFFCLQTITKIIRPRSIYVKDRELRFKAYSPKAGDFHFFVDLNKNGLEEYCQQCSNLNYDDLVNGRINDYGIINLSVEFVCEAIIPELYFELACRPKEFLTKFPQAKELQNYLITAD